MANNGNTSPTGQQQQTPVVNGSQRITELEDRVRKIENTINQVSGVMGVLRWIGPSLVIGGVGVLIFFLGQASVNG